MNRETNAEKQRQLRNATWAYKTQKVLSIAAQIAQDVLTLRQNPSIRDFAAMGIKVVDAVAERVGGDVESYFDDWWCIEDLTFVNNVMSIIKNYPTKKLGGPDDYAIMLTEVFGEEIGWIKTSHFTDDRDEIDRAERNWYQGPWIHLERLDQVYCALGRALWENMTSKYAVISSRTSRVDHTVTEHVSIKPDMEIAQDVHESKMGNVIYDQLQSFYNAGINRSVMLLGPPGSGKTTIMKAIARRFDKFTLRINIHELSSIPVNVVIDGIKILRPEILIIDDFDRMSGGHTSLLTALEMINKFVRILIVSVNNISEIDPAVIRPGRIDMIIEIDKIDDDVINKLLDQYQVPNEVRTMLSKWPVAFIHEFAKRAKVLGVEATIAELIELRYRVEQINHGRHGTGLPTIDEMIATFEKEKE